MTDNSYKVGRFGTPTHEYFLFMKREYLYMSIDNIYLWTGYMGDSKFMVSEDVNYVQVEGNCKLAMAQITSS